MSQNECEHIRPDGARCQAPLQTGKSFCFFHDPEQQEKRAAARRSGGFMRDQAYRAPSRTEAPPVLPENVPYIAVQTRDEIAYALQMIICWLLLGQIDPKVANVLIFGLSVASANLAAEERKEREAARAAERAAERAAREAFTKEAIARQLEAAVRDALKKAGFNSQSRFSGTDENSPPFQRREREIREEEFLAAAGNREAQRSEIKEEPIIIDASKPWDPRQFAGKKPRISCVVPVFTSMRTGKIIDVNEPNPLDPPEHMLRDEFRRKPAAPTAPAGPQAAPIAGRVGAPAEKSRDSGTDERLVGHGFSHDGAKRTEPFQRREGEITQEEFHSAEGPRGAERSATDKTAEPETREGATANGGKSDPEPKDAKPKKNPNNPYSITTLLPDPPRLFESKPRDACTDPPETPPPPKPKPGPRLHPWIEYWGLH